MDRPQLVETSAVRARGYSLIEAILASFLLVFTFFLVSSLFHTGLSYSVKVDRRIAAAKVAQKRMSEVRRWAKDHPEPGWSGYPNNPTDAEYSAFTIDTRLEPYPLYGPNKALEASYSSQRVMGTVARQAIVTVSYPRSAPYVLTSLVTKPEVGGNVAISVAGDTTTPLGPGVGRTFTATAQDGAGNALSDVFFHWQVEPVGANPTSASIKRIERDGTTASLRNSVQRRDRVPVPRAGTCRVQAYVRYHGKIYTGQTPVITLVN